MLPLLSGCGDSVQPDGITDVPVPSAARVDGLDAELRATLATLGFTGRVGSTLEARLGRRVDHRLADVGRMLWFDPITGLNDDNSCAGCHSPTNGFGDTQSIAIGIENNRIVGPDRRGPRNQRRTPMAINSAFFPTLMWNSRFRALSGDPFNNSAGLQFPPPEGRHALLPPTPAHGAGVHSSDRARRGGGLRVSGRQRRHPARGGAARQRERRLPPPVRRELRRRCGAAAAITYDHLAAAIAEFEFTLVFANAPIDRYARGETHALSDGQKNGALLFFGRAGCVACHQVSGQLQRDVQRLP